MTSLIGLHWIRTHPDGRDLAHIEAMQYPSVKLFEWHWNNRDACHDLLAALPQDSYILARDHPMSEQKQDMWNDPAGTGTRHANEWAMKVASGQVHTPDDRTFFLGINEPDATSGDRNAIDVYTQAFLSRLRVHGLRGGAFNFSTGHPRTVDGTPSTPADYTVFEQSHRAIVEGHHIGVLHIYGTAAQPLAPGHFDRLKACAWQDVEWVVGEFGIDEHVIGGGEHKGYLASVPSPMGYCEWLDTAIMGINDARIHSYQVFTYDFSHPWASFDIRPGRDALEGYQWRHMSQQPTTPPIDTHLPVIVGDGPTPPTKPTRAYVIAPAGANIRQSPTTESPIVGAVPYGDEILIIGVESIPGWVRVRYGNKEGYMASDLIGTVAPKPLPAPTEPPVKPVEPQPMPTAGVLDPQVLEAILMVESGGRGFGENGALVIRLEAHIFKSKLGNDALWAQHFDANDVRPWTEQEWRKIRGDPWRTLHTGQQSEEYAAFSLAMDLNKEAAHLSISMGAAQIMGFNHARIGYPNAVAMFGAFQRSINAQLIGFINYFLTDAALVAAIRRKNWEAIALGYNGAGNVAEASAKYRAAYEKVIST